MWHHSSSPKPLFTRTHSARKIVACVLWGRERVLLYELITRWTIIHADRYCKTIRELGRAMQNNRKGISTKAVHLHHDDAWPRSARATAQPYPTIWLENGHSTAAQVERSPEWLIFFGNSSNKSAEVVRTSTPTRRRKPEFSTARRGTALTQNWKKGAPSARMHWSKRGICRKIGQCLSLSKMCKLRWLNLFFYVKKICGTYFANTPRNGRLRSLRSAQ